MSGNDRLVNNLARYVLREKFGHVLTVSANEGLGLSDAELAARFEEDRAAGEKRFSRIVESILETGYPPADEVDP